MVNIFISACLIIVTAATGIVSDIDIYRTGGAIVVGHGGPSFQLNGMIWGDYKAHEYGHYVQQQEMGSSRYYLCVAIPSVIANGVDILLCLSGVPSDRVDKAYYKLPWEVEATLLGKQFRIEN